MNPVINIDENDPIYSELVNIVSNADDSKLTIVARSEKNRKDDKITPIAIINGIYFYAAYSLGGAMAYIGKPTPDQIYKAKDNLEENVILMTYGDMLSDDGKSIKDFKDTNSPMILATTKNKENGAGILYSPKLLLEIMEKIGSFRILPSSIHELILVPDKENIEISALDNMVKEVNRTNVDEREYLADRSFALREWL